MNIIFKEIIICGGMGIWEVKYILYKYWLKMSLTFPSSPYGNNRIKITISKLFLWPYLLPFYPSFGSNSFWKPFEMFPMSSMHFSWLLQDTHCFPSLLFMPAMVISAISIQKATGTQMSTKDTAPTTIHQCRCRGCQHCAHCGESALNHFPHQCHWSFL